MDVSFDELYHREKSLIDDVALLEKELREAVQNQDPYDFAVNMDWDKIKAESELYESDLEYETMARPASDMATTNKDFSVVEQQQREKWKHRNFSEWDDTRHTMKMNNLTNRGYAFVTFSHVDEARKCLLAHEDTCIGLQPIEVFLKNDLDHGDFDMSYVHA